MGLMDSLSELSDVEVKKTTPVRTRKTKTKKVNNWILDEFKQLKLYFRKGERPAMKAAIENFEQHLKELI